MLLQGGTLQPEGTFSNSGTVHVQTGIFRTNSVANLTPSSSPVSRRLRLPVELDRRHITPAISLQQLDSQQVTVNAAIVKLRGPNANFSNFYPAVNNGTIELSGGATLPGPASDSGRRLTNNGMIVLGEGGSYISRNVITNNGIIQVANDTLQPSQPGIIESVGNSVIRGNGYVNQRVEVYNTGNESATFTINDTIALRQDLRVFGKARVTSGNLPPVDGTTEVGRRSIFGNIDGEITIDAGAKMSGGGELVLNSGTLKVLGLLEKPISVSGAFNVSGQIAGQTNLNNADLSSTGHAQFADVVANGNSRMGNGTYGAKSLNVSSGVLTISTNSSLATSESLRVLSGGRLEILGSPSQHATVTVGQFVGQGPPLLLVGDFTAIKRHF